MEKNLLFLKSLVFWYGIIVKARKKRRAKDSAQQPMMQINYYLICLSDFFKLLLFHNLLSLFLESFIDMSDKLFFSQDLLPDHFSLAQIQPVSNTFSAQYQFQNAEQIRLHTQSGSGRGKVLLKLIWLKMHPEVNCFLIEQQMKTDNDLFILWNTLPL